MQNVRRCRYMCSQIVLRISTHAMISRKCRARRRGPGRSAIRKSLSGVVTVRAINYIYSMDVLSRSMLFLSSSES